MSSRTWPLAALLVALLAQSSLAITIGDASIHVGSNAGTGACALDPLPGHIARFHAAVNLKLFPEACGRCLWVKGGSGHAFIARVTDDCATCGTADVDLSQEAFKAVTGAEAGLSPVSWEWAESCSQPASASSAQPTSTGNRRMLAGDSAEATKSALQGSDGQPGELTDWVVACEDGRTRCPSLFLASWGYQCANEGGDSCCLRPNGKDCTRLDAWGDADTPATWMGHDLAGSQGDGQAVDQPDDSQQADGEQGAGDDASDEADSQGSDEADSQDSDEDSNGDDSGDSNGDDSGDSSDDSSDDSVDQRATGHGHGKSASSSSGKWQSATSTYYTSYPPCCSDSRADQTECEDYSGCKYQGLFAGVNGRKSKSWVKSNNIVAFFEAPNSNNRKVWARKWKGRTLRIRNPDTGKTLDVTILDTCDDDDCGGCCTRNANRNGGHLVDLEYHTAQRFWGRGIPGVARIQYQVL